MHLNKSLLASRTPRRLPRVTDTPIAGTPGIGDENAVAAILGALTGLQLAVEAQTERIFRLEHEVSELRGELEAIGELVLEAGGSAEVHTVDEADNFFFEDETVMPRRVIGIAGLHGDQRTVLDTKLSSHVDIVWIDHKKQKPSHIGPVDHMYVTRFVDGDWLSETRKLYQGRFTKVNGTSAIVNAVLGE